MDLLARREHSRHELCKKLVAKGFDSDEVAQVVTELASEGLQDDTRFTEAYVRYRADAGFGPHRILMELQERGVAEILVDRFLWNRAMDWQTFLRSVWQKKFGERASFGTKEYTAQLRFLMQRGFEPDKIHDCLQERRIDIADAQK